jgi:L-ascorbate metabolism protein UlaG (beta-lactamase superfamily)
MNTAPFVLRVALGLALAGAQSGRDRPLQLEATDPACRSAQLVSTGGSFPRDPHVVAIRWTGYSNFELAYNGQIALLDAYFDRGSLYPPLGFTAADVRRANVILIGHGHFDHMSDAASVGARTGAVVVGAPLTIARLEREPIDATQLKTVNGRGGEVLRFGSFTIEPILARHGEPPADVTRAFNAALSASTTAPAAAQRAEQAAISARGTSDPRVVTEGTIAYLITLDDGFRILYRDSGGKVTDYERAVAQRAGSVDVVIAATSASFVTSLLVDQALEYVRTYHPRAFMPAHHDAARDALWRPTEPIFQAIKDENPNVLTISKGYREPVCFVTP